MSKTNTNTLLRIRGCRAVLISAVLMLAACASHNIVQAPSGRFQLQPGGFNQVSVEQEIQLGKEAEQQVYQQYPVLPDSDPVSQYVQQLGQRLASHAPGDVKWPLSYHVVATKEINAFALPGGPVFVNLGAITAADNEGQLAGVLAHETSHVVLRHSTQQASKAMLAQIPLAVLGAVIGDGTVGQLAQLGIQFGAESVFLKYSRDAEKEADLLGSQIMYDTGYDPYDMVEFFDKLQKQGGQGAPQFLSDHPNPGNRVEYVKQAISKYPRKRYTENNAQFDRIKQLAKQEENQPHPKRASAPSNQGGPAPTQQPTMQPVPLEQVAPSSQFKALDHSAFQIEYPANWQAMGNANSSVTIAPQAGVSQNAIAYGVIISGFQPEQGRDSLDAATQYLLGSLQQGNPGMRQAGNAQQISVNGAPAISVPLISPSPIQGSNGPVAERDWLITVQRPRGGVLFIIAIAPDEQFAQFQPAYEQMLRSLRVK